MEKQGGTKAIVSGAIIGGGISGLSVLLHNRVSKEIRQERIDARINEAKENTRRYWEEYIEDDNIDFSDADIDRAYKDVKVFSEKEWIKRGYGEYYTGMNVDKEEILLRESYIHTETPEHEGGHGIGSLYNLDKDGNEINVNGYRRGVDEAATQLFALESTGKKSNPNNAYSYNVQILKNMKEDVDTVVHKIPGYENKDLLKLSYVDKTHILDGDGIVKDTKDIFFDAMDEIMASTKSEKKIKKTSPRYIPFSERMMNFMNISDGGNGSIRFTADEIKEARNKLDEMQTQLYKEVLRRELNSIDLK